MAQIASSTMKAIGLTNPEGEIEEIQLPISELKPTDLLVRVEAVSINPVDYKKLESLRKQTVSKQNPGILGFDASGVVVQTGSACKLFKVGDQVIYAGDYGRYGSNANFQVVDERIVGKKPKKLSHSHASAIPLVGLTAYEGLVEEMGIQENKKENQNKVILVIGGAGGVGSTVIQIAKKVLNLKVVATASRIESVEFCKKMGADFVINHKNPLAEELKKINIESVDYIYNTVEMTLSYYNQFVSLIKPLGHIVGIVGFDEPLNLSGLFFKRARISIECMFTRSFFNEQPEKQNETLNKLSALYDKGTFISTVQVEKPFTLENLKEAHQISKSGQTIGKVVLTDVQSFFGVEKSKKISPKSSCFN